MLHPLHSLQRFVARRRLFAALFNKDYERVAAALDQGADPNWLTRKCWTPLLIATLLERTDIITLLLRRGARFPDERTLVTHVRILCEVQTDDVRVLLISHFNYSASTADILAAAASEMFRKQRHLLAIDFLREACRAMGWSSAEVLASRLKLTPINPYCNPVHELLKGYYELGLADSFRTDDGDRAFHAALRYGEEAIARELILAGADADQVGAKFEIPLQIAAASNLRDLFPLLLKSTRGCTVPPPEARKKMRWEITIGYDDEIIAYLKAGGDPNLGNSDNDLPILAFAAIHGHDRLIASLIRHGADARTVHPQYGGVFGYAAQNCGVATLRLLLWAGASPVQSFDDRHEIPFVGAAVKQQPEALELMLDHGVPIDVRSGTETALMRACHVNNAEAVRFLIERGADLHARSASGWTPVHWAAMGNSLDAMKILIERHANLYAQDSGGKTPKDFAHERRNEEVENLLRAHGCTDEYSVPDPLLRTTFEITYDFFISYRQRKYREPAGRLKRMLAGAGCTCFVDVEAPELACINDNSSVLPRDEIKAILYSELRSSACTIFFEAWDEAVFDPVTETSRRAFNWQRFEHIHSRHVLLVQTCDPFSDGGFKKVLAYRIPIHRAETETIPPHP